MQAANGLQQWAAQLDRRVYAILIGLIIGAAGGAIGIGIALAGPLLTAGAILGLLAALYVLTNVTAALYGVVVIMALLPFGTFPFRVGFTPTLLDAAIGAFVLVYLLQWMTGRRHALRLTPIHGFILLYMGWLILSFVLGLRYGRLTPTIMRQFAETLLSISLTFIFVDLLRDRQALRRLIVVIILAAGAQAVVSLALYALPDDLAERTLVRLARIGYPDGGVIRYIEDNPDLAERAIGTWVDPNAMGGFSAIMAALITPQLFARRPVLPVRWLSWGIIGLLAVVLLLTYSRASMLAFGFGLLFTNLFRENRKLLALMILGGIGLLFLPETQQYIARFIQAFTGSDLATQMRLGEYGDSLELISRYPITGVGFTGTPEIDLYTDVASMYLIMANQIGLVGVGLFALAIGAVFVYGRMAWRYVRDDELLRPVFIGCHAALITVLINATADLYFFRLDFQGSITLFWLTVSLAVTSSRLAFARASEHEFTVDP